MPPLNEEKRNCLHQSVSVPLQFHEKFWVDLGTLKNTSGLKYQYTQNRICTNGEATRNPKLASFCIRKWTHHLQVNHGIWVSLHAPRLVPRDTFHLPPATDTGIFHQGRNIWEDITQCFSVSCWDLKLNPHGSQPTSLATPWELVGRHYIFQDKDNTIEIHSFKHIKVHVHICICHQQQQQKIENDFSCEGTERELK